jgi:chromosome segregation ATPase
MSISTIIERGRIREDRLWSTFSHDPFGGNKIILFGLYANTYLHGYAYLTELSGERLIQIVADFDNKMDRLSAEEQQVVMDLATKRYIDTIDNQIHDQKMTTKRSDIDAKDQEFDAKFEALESDRLAILTQRERLAQKIEKARAEILVLEARIAEEEVSSTQVIVDISKAELGEARTRLQILEAGLRGMNLQYDIANAAVQRADLLMDKQKTQQDLDLIPAALKELEAAIKNLEADQTRTETAIDMVDVDIGELENRKDRAEMDAESRNIDVDLLDVDIAKAGLDTAMVDVEILETQARTAREIARRADIEVDIAMVDIRIAQIQLDIEKVNVQLVEIEADIATMNARLLRKDLLEIAQYIAIVRKENAEYEIPAKRDAQIEAIEKQIEVLQSKIDAEEAYAALEGTIHGSRMDQQQAEHDHRMVMTGLTDEYRIHRANVKIESFAKDILLATYERLSQEVQDQERIKVPESQILASYIRTNAAEDAAETMASADIVNTLTHAIGAM